jgi:hypothetical protein
VASVANLSKSSQALLDVEVARSAELSAVEGVAAELAERLCADPVAGPLITGSPTPARLIGVRDDRLQFRLTVAAVPGQHDDIVRIWRGLVLAAYRDGTLPPPSVIAAAAPGG